MALESNGLTMKPLRCIAAMDIKRGIGKNNNLPWRLRNEMTYFTRITSNVKQPGCRNVTIMGRRSWESIPTKHRPLANRINIILSKTLCPSDVPNEVVIKPTLKDAMTHISALDDIENVFIIGGYGVYKEAVESPYCDRIYLTQIFGEFDCDAFFPNFDETTYKRVSNDDVPEGIQEEKGIKYEFRLYQRDLESN